MNLEEGDRAEILPHWNWPEACTGRITSPPELARSLVEGRDRWLGCRRLVHGRKGPIEYRGGEVEAQYLRQLERRPISRTSEDT